MSADHTEQKFPFRPRARLLQLLGDQLIGTPRLAIFELVKNAYDADAERVTVRLLDFGKPEASIIVEDDGDGMSLETVRDIWLVPAHDHRGRQRQAMQRTRLNRLPLGEKGLGRFAVHKLGDRIDVVTRAAGQPEVLVSIDWKSQIDRPFLSDTEVVVRTRSPELFTGKRTGTWLRITSLREADLSRGDVRRLLRQITSISSPYRGRSDTFEAKLEVPDNPDWITDVPDTEGLLARAPWQYKFTFDGKLAWEYRFIGITGLNLEGRSKSASDQPLQIAAIRDFDQFGSDQGQKTLAPRKVTADDAILQGLGPVSGTFFVYDREPAILNRLGSVELVKNFLNENGGVRVYRDGIRVYNYGESGDDWLGLDLRRVNTPTRNISRNIIIGAVDLDLAASDQLIEKTNREGFVENGVYRRLQQIVLGALAVFETERKIDKDDIRALTDKGRDPEIDRIAKPLDALRTAARKNHVAEQLDPLIDKVERDYNEMRDTMLRAGLSGMGLAVVFHEIEQGVRVLHDAIEAGGRPETIQTQARELVRILDGFTELLRKGDKKPNSLQHLVRRGRDINRVRFRNHNVRLVCPALDEGADDAQPSFAFSLALGALNNLLDNAFYWLQVRWGEDDIKPPPRAIYMNIDFDFAEGPAIIVADTGTGFVDEPDRLTRPFFSRRPDGMGVGLYYANLVMELNSGRLAFPDRDEANVPEEFDGAVIALIFGKPKAG